MQLKTYSTSNVEPSVRVAYWNRLHGALFAPLDVRPTDDEHFDASLRSDVMGTLVLTKICSCPVSLEHTAQHVTRMAARRFFLLLSLNGTARVRHYGHEVLLEKDAYLLLDTAAPYGIEFDTPHEAISVQVADEELRRYIPVPETACGLKMAGLVNLSSVVVTMLKSLWAQVEFGLPETFGRLLTKNFLEVAGGSYALACSPKTGISVAASLRRAQVKQFIENNLRDCQLTPTSIGRNLGVSPRYIRSLFAAEQEHLCEYVLRRRLEECAAELRRPVWPGRTITDIAFSWGFNAMPHFNRVFKERFGMTPRRYCLEHRSKEAHVD